MTVHRTLAPRDRSRRLLMPVGFRRAVSSSALDLCLSFSCSSASLFSTSSIPPSGVPSFRQSPRRCLYHHLRIQMAGAVGAKAKCKE